jgi:hypothetical protein
MAIDLATFLAITACLLACALAVKGAERATMRPRPALPSSAGR